MSVRLYLPFSLILFLFFTAKPFAATYYVKPDGNNSLDGLSDAKAWRTIGKVNSHTFATGDDVYFKCGGTWTDDVLKIDWKGSAGNRAVVGAYYMQGDVETAGVSGNKPVIDGENKRPTNASYSGLIHVSSGSSAIDAYVTVQDLKIVHSGGLGIRVRHSRYVTVSRVEVADTWLQGCWFDTSDHGILEFSDFTDMNNYGNGACVIFKDSDGCLARHNVVHESDGWSEGINLYLSDNTTVEYNIVYDTKACLIYLDHANGGTVRYNMLYYTKNTKYWRNGSKPSSGFWFANEPFAGDTHLTRDIEIYGNVVANVEYGIRMNVGKIGSKYPNCRIFNNTFCEPHESAVWVSSTGHTSKIQNNIFLQSNGTIANVSTNSGITFSNNLWPQPRAQVDPDAQGPGDVYGQAPKLMKTSGWHNSSPGGLDGSEFALQPGSPAIDAGANLASQYQQMPESDQSKWPRNIVLMDQNSHGSGWEIGADIYIENPSNPPAAPTGLRIK